MPMLRFRHNATKTKFTDSTEHYTILYRASTYDIYHDNRLIGYQTNIKAAKRFCQAVYDMGIDTYNQMSPTDKYKFAQRAKKDILDT